MQETVPVPDEATKMPPHARPRAAAKPSLYDYPASDGRPMGETPFHWRAMVDAADPLRAFFADRPDVYVGSNMMMYYIEDDTNTSVSPDVFVTFGVPKLPERRVWRTWVEGGRFADFVLELTSESSRGRDGGSKKELFARLGVREYWQFDPEGKYLAPRLKGHRLHPEGRYESLVLVERDGALCGESLLGLELRLEGARLRLYDTARREYLRTHTEERRAHVEERRARLREARERRNAETALEREARAHRSTEAALRAEIDALRRRLRGTEQ